MQTQGLATEREKATSPREGAREDIERAASREHAKQDGDVDKKESKTEAAFRKTWPKASNQTNRKYKEKMRKKCETPLTQGLLLISWC